MANILYRGSATPSTVNAAGGKNAALTNLEIDQNFYALDRDKFDRVLGGTITGNATFDTSSTVTINGNLIVNGTQTTINSTTLSVDDINVTLGDISNPTNITANGGGITLKGATDKTFNWISSTSAWTSSEHLSLASGKNILLNGSTSGTITLAAPATAGTNTITFQAATGTVAHLADIGNGTITVNTGSGLSGSGSFTTNQSGATTVTLSHADTSTQASSSNTGNTFIQSVTLDDYGHITAMSTGSVTIGNGTFTVSAGSGMTGGGQLGTANQSGNSSVTLTHATTTTQGSVSNSAGTIIQSISLDASFGHVTGISSIDGDARWVNVTGDTMTGRLVISAGTNGGIAFPNDSFGGSGDIASITLENPAGGEATRMTFRIGNDSDDLFNFIAPSNNGLLMNGNTVWHSGNDGSGSGLDADTVDGLHIHTGRNNEANKLVRTDATGYIQAGYINSSSGDEKNNSNPSYVWGTNGSDSYLRTYSTGSLSVNYANSAGSAGSAGYTTKLRRRDDASDYNVQTSWGTDKTGYWSLRGYSGDTYHAGVWVAWAGDATNAGYSSTVGINYDNNSNSTYQMLWGSGNSVYGTSGIYCNPYTDMLYADSFQATSDIRKKHNVKTIENALSKVQDLRGVSFTMNDSNKNMIGVVAQEILEVIPEVVDEGADGTLTVAYGNIVGVLIEAIKELNAKVEDLQNQLANK